MGAAGIALRVPTPNVSVVDLVVQTEKKTFAEEVNEAFRESSRGAQKVCIHETVSWLLLICVMCAVLCIVSNAQMLRIHQGIEM